MCQEKKRERKQEQKAVRNGFHRAGVAQLVHARHDLAQLFLRRAKLRDHADEQVVVGSMVPRHARVDLTSHFGDVL